MDQMMNKLFSAHGKKLKFLRMQMAKGWYNPGGTVTPNLRMILGACPDVTDLTYDLPHFDEYDCLEMPSNPAFQLRRIGIYSTQVMWKRLLPDMRTRIRRLRNARLAKSLKTVRMMDISGQSLRREDDREFGNLLQYFAAWSEEWKKKGVRLEDSSGKLFSEYNL